MKEHYRRLIHMYRSGRIHGQFPKMEMELSQGYCRILTSTDSTYHHAAGGAHGLMYFKFLDEAGYFAAATVEEEYFLLTKSMSIDFIRPIISGELIAEGKLLHLDTGSYQAKASLYHHSKLVGKANLELVPGKMKLEEVEGYSEFE